MRLSAMFLGEQAAARSSALRRTPARTQIRIGAPTIARADGLAGALLRSAAWKRVKWSSGCHCISGAGAAAGCRESATDSAAPRPGSAAAAIEQRCRAGAREGLARPPGTRRIGRFQLEYAGAGRLRRRPRRGLHVRHRASGGVDAEVRVRAANGEHIKVKYGEVILNGEVPAEIAATRLLNGPGLPHRPHERSQRPLPRVPAAAAAGAAMPGRERARARSACRARTRSRSSRSRTRVIERPIKGDKIEGSKDQGWAWYELDTIDPRPADRRRAEVDALRLMAILLAHWDNKGPNQKLICPPGASGLTGPAAHRWR